MRRAPRAGSVLCGEYAATADERFGVWGGRTALSPDRHTCLMAHGRRISCALVGHDVCMDQVPFWVLPTFSLVGVVVGSVLTAVGQGINASKAHDRAKELRDEQWNREDAERIGRERAQAGVVVQEALRRMHEAHQEQRGLSLTLREGFLPKLPEAERIATNARVRANMAEFWSIFISLSLVAAEPAMAAKKVSQLAYEFSDDDPENMRILDAVNEFDRAARQWLEDNTDGPLAQHRYK